MLRTFKRRDKGFTVTELMIAVAITGFFVLVIVAVMNQLSTFEKDVSKRLMDDFLIVNSHKRVIADLEGTYWSRLGIFSCSSSDSLMTTDGESKLTLSGDGSGIEFVRVDLASTVGLAPIVNTIVVAEAAKLRAGDYVLLNLASAMSEAGLFKVESVDAATKYVKIKSTTLSEEGSSCHDSLSAKNLSAFFGPNIKSNTLLSRVNPVKYTLEKGVFARQTWPGTGVAEPVLDGVNQVTISAKWTPTSDDSEGKKIYGRMNYKVDFNIEQSTMASNAAKYYQGKAIEAQYNLNAFQISNIYSPVGAPSVAMNFPTCSVNQEYKAGILKLNPSLELYRNTISLKLTGSVSESIPAASINIAFSPSTGATVQCFKHDPATGSYPPPSIGGLVEGPGVSGSITLNQGATGFDVYTCAVRGLVALTASMSYFDTNLNQVKTINCSAESIEAPTKYRFGGSSTPSCNGFGFVNLGSSFSGDDSNVYYGKFGINMETSCQWSGEPDAFATGISGSCYAWEHPFKSLKRIYLRPYKMDVMPKDGTSSVFPSSGASVNCN